MGLTVLIVGSAPSVYSDLYTALQLRPNADVIAVKFSVVLVHAPVAVTHHGEYAEPIKELHRKRWGDDVQIFAPKKLFTDEQRRHIDREWHELAGVGGTSAWGAARMAKLLGASEVILCGCPIEPTEPGKPYHHPMIYQATYQHGIRNQRGEPFANPAAVRGYQRFIESDIQLGNAEGIYSMSGWTRKALGAPHGIH